MNLISKIIIPIKKNNNQKFSRPLFVFFFANFKSHLNTYIFYIPGIIKNPFTFDLLFLCQLISTYQKIFRTKNSLLYSIPFFYVLFISFIGNRLNQIPLLSIFFHPRYLDPETKLFQLFQTNIENNKK